MVTNNKSNQKHKDLFHDTKTLLRAYRKTKAAHVASVEEHQERIAEEYGGDISGVDMYLEHLKEVGFSFEGTKLENHAKSLARSQKMIEIVEAAAHVVCCMAKANGKK